mmetsp:Transcript_141998/g.247527  ORF Transcript_141998/g.247527 Transcript_141998/m.247527 type:complete len:92 (+) Transcript_141998:1911-2186(+)
MQPSLLLRERLGWPFWTFCCPACHSVCFGTLRVQNRCVPPTQDPLKLAQEALRGGQHTKCRAGKLTWVLQQSAKCNCFSTRSNWAALADDT